MHITASRCSPSAWLLGRFVLALGLLVLAMGSPGLRAATADPDGSQPWTANWIWDASNGTPYSFMRFRTTVNLATTYSSLPTRISCDSKYALWVNGTPVVRDGNALRGPTRNDGYYDTVDLGPYLHAGSNTIAALVEFLGKGGGDGYNANVNSGKGGFILEASTGGSVVIQTGSSWKASLNAAFSNGNGSGNSVEGPITFDARLDDGGWTQVGFDDSGWPAATAKGVPPTAPWGNLWSSGLPVLKDYGLMSYVSQSTSGNRTTCTLPYNAQISPALELGAGTQAGQSIVITTTNPLNKVKVTYLTKAGVQSWEAPGFIWMNGEAVTYDFPAGVVVAGLKYRELGYNTTFNPMSSSDSALNTLMTKAKRTVYISKRHQYMDCPDRERGQWIGDMTSQIGQDLYGFSASVYPMIRKGYKSALFFSGNDGNRMYSLSPPGTYGFMLQNQMLPVLSTQGVWMYYQFSGDTAVLNYSASFFTRILQSWSLDPGTGMPAYQGNWWDDGNINSGRQPNHDAWVYQVGLYYSACLATKKIIGEIGGHVADLAWVNARITSIQQNFNTVFWNGSEYRSPACAASSPSLPAYTGDTDERGAAWAVINGLADAGKYSQIRGTLTSHFHASVFSEQWCEQALYLMGYPDDAVNRMKSQYAPMINSPITTLWENFPPAGTTTWNSGNGTMDHGWAGGSLQMINRYGAGIYPITPGCATMQIQPALGSLSSFSTRVATLKGDLPVAYTQTASAFTANLTVPAGMTSVQLYLPTKGGGDVSINGVTMLHGGAVTTPVAGVTYVGLGGAGNGAYVFTVTPGSWNFGVNSTGTLPPPAAPSGLTASANSSSQITLAWNAVGGATGYNIYRGTSAGGEGASPINGSSPLTATTYTDSGLSAATRYFYIAIAINSAGSSAASNEANATTSPLGIAPTITTQPSNQTVTVGQSASFTVVASGTPSPLFQWQRNNVNVVGATSPSYTTPVTVIGDNGATFRCVVSNSAGSVTSNAASLTVTAPTLRTPENPTGAVAGLAYRFFEVATTDGTLPAFASLTPTASGTIANVDLSPRTRDDHFAFVFNSYLEVPTDGVYTLYTTSDDGSRLLIGTTTVVDNDGSHGMQERSGTIGLKAGRHALTVQFAQGVGGLGLEVRWEGTGTVKSLIPASAWFRDAGTGTGNVAPLITSQPANRSVGVGQTAAFAVAATGTPTPTFQWQRNNTNISGANSASYTTPAVVIGDSGTTFRCVASNSAGSVTSSSATLTVTTTVDTSPPPTPPTPTVTGNGTANPTLSGTAEAGVVITLLDAGVVVGTTIATGGTWTMTPTLAAGAHSLHVTATDAAGNVSGTSGAVTVTVVAGSGSVATSQNDSSGKCGIGSAIGVLFLGLGLMLAGLMRWRENAGPNRRQP